MRSRTSGYTLVELLVVISIIGILIALSLPGIQAAREAMRRTECANNLAEIALATSNFEASKGQLPGYCQKFGQFAGGIDRADPGNYSGNVPPHVKVGPWQVALLAKLDNQPIYERWTEDQYPLLSDGAGEHEATFEGYSSERTPNLGFFQCPSSSGTIATKGRNSYIANTGMHAAFPFTYTRPGGAPVTVTFADSMDRSNGMFHNRYAGFDPANPSRLVPIAKAISFDDVRDGLTNTLLYSENQQAQPWYLTSLSGNANHLMNIQTVNGKMVTPYQSESRYLQGAVWHFADSNNYAGAPAPAAVHRINGGDVYNLQMDSTNVADVARPSSLHNHGVNIAFADGSVRFVDNSIDYRTYQAMLTPSGKASDVPNNLYIPSREL